MEEYMGIIKLFAGNFAPKGWLMCDGSTLPVSSYSALFSLLGTTYGGDGIRTFKLPDLRSRVPIGTGQGSGLSNYSLGQMQGKENVTLGIVNLPPHSHSATLNVSNSNANTSPATQGLTLATPGVLVGRDFNPTLGFVQDAPNVNLNGASVTVGVTGSGQPIPTISPSVALNYIICVDGIYPPRP